ncbi:MAG: HsdR family type I site-specific deoxyribonuclease [Muribaculaceae bacterium]|nr:HsdR family type I site-specific deoxyribonuclease [Muribaculaceae bacterium]
MRYFIREDDIEKELIGICLNELGYDNHFNCYAVDHLNRSSEREVLNLDVLRREIKRINQSETDLPNGLDNADVETAVNALKDIDLYSDPKELNAKVLSRIITGYRMPVLQANGKREPRTVQYIDWSNPASNQFDVVNQLWIQGDSYRLRPDVIIYVNGLPLITIELKDSNIPVKEAFDNNLTRYKDAIPQLMVYNAVLVASNGLHTRVGSTFADWTYFSPWFRNTETDKVDKEHIEGEKISLDIMARSLLSKDNLLNYIHNFILFYNGTKKITAKNHQFLGVNNAVDRYKYLCGNPPEEDRGKMGVFWHTQGSGKSFSMVFLARYLKNRFPGNFTFLIITDREDLDDQIYRNFLHSGFMSESEECRPKSSDSLRRMLGEDHRILFTLIQKFRYDKRKQYPLLSERDDIIVFIDEAHRTQYKALAENLRAGLPNAKYMAFTGTPLFGSKKLTNKWFGKTVSEYNFSQAVEDEATVRLTYRNHLPEVQNENPTFSADFIRILEDEELDDDSRQRLEREHAKELEILKRPARLNKIADDIVNHIINRGYLGKAMVVSVDRFTTVKMYDLVTAKWQTKIAELNHELISLNPSSKEYQQKLKIRDWMRTTDMAVVISLNAGDDERFAAEGLNIVPHRDRMNDVNDEGQELQDLFRDENNPLRIVFVCSMWLTGFDSPMVSTLYMDKPLAGQNLMQTIARANRRCSTLDVLGREKKSGQIISYCNIFGSLKKAFATYGDAQGDDDDNSDDTGTGTTDDGDSTMAAMTLEELYAHLHDAIDKCVAWCDDLGVDLQKILDLNKVFSQISLFDQYADILIHPIERKAQFMVYDNTINQLYDECLPDIIPHKQEFVMAEVIHYLRNVMDNAVDRGNLASARRRIKDLLNQSIVPKGDGPAENREYTIKEFGEFDLSRLDIDKLREQYGESKCQALEIEDLQDFISQKLDAMLHQNSERRPFAEEFQRIIDRYNAGSTESEQAIKELIELLSRMTAEQRRAAEEGLTEEELEVFDILRKENLSKADEIKVKAAAKDLLSKLKANQDELCTTDWYKDSSKKSTFTLFVRNTLDKSLPDSYDRITFGEKSRILCDQLIIRAAQNGGYLFAG